MVQGTSQAAVTEKSHGHDDLATVDEAVKALRLSREFLYKLPKSTPGVHRFGRILRFDIAELRRWARTQAEKSVK